VDIYVDVDECETGEHNCQQLCNNLPGSYNCSCDTGFTLNDNGTNCTGKNRDCIQRGPFFNPVIRDWGIYNPEIPVGLRTLSLC